MLKITLVRSQIGVPRKLRAVVTGLGLRKLNSSVIRQDTPQVRGMIFKVKHLLDVTEIDGNE